MRNILKYAITGEKINCLLQKNEWKNMLLITLLYINENVLGNTSKLNTIGIDKLKTSM